MTTTPAPNHAEHAARIAAVSHRYVIREPVKAVVTIAGVTWEAIMPVRPPVDVHVERPDTRFYAIDVVRNGERLPHRYHVLGEPKACLLYRIDHDARPGTLVLPLAAVREDGVTEKVRAALEKALIAAGASPDALQHWMPRASRIYAALREANEVPADLSEPQRRVLEVLHGVEHASYDDLTARLAGALPEGTSIVGLCHALQACGLVHRVDVSTTEVPKFDWRWGPDESLIARCLARGQRWLVRGQEIA